MSRRLAVVAAVGLATLACQDARDTVLTGPELQLTGPACKYSDVKKYARNLFGSNSPGYALAAAMSGFAPNSDDATNKAFDIFAAIAAKRDATTFTTQNLDDAANLTLQVVRCANVGSTSHNTGPVPL